MDSTAPLPETAADRSDLSWNEELRQRVLEKIRASGYSRREAAQAIGWNHGSLSQWLNPKTVQPAASPKTVRRIAAWLEASEEETARWLAGAVARRRATLPQLKPLPSPSHSDADAGRPWNQELRNRVIEEIRRCNLTRHQAARAIGTDPAAFNAWLNGETVLRRKTVQGIAAWLEVSEENTKLWIHAVDAYWQAHPQRGGSVEQTCAVCGRPRRVGFAQLNSRRKHPWTCSDTCHRLVTLKPGPTATPGNHNVFAAVRGVGSSTVFQQQTGLSRREVHQFCTDPKYAPAAATRARLAAAIPDRPWAELFPTTAADKSRETLRSVHAKYPKKSAAAKHVLGKGGQTRKGRHYPKLSEALQQAAHRKMQDDPDYGRRVAQRLARGQQTPRWKALRLLLVHLRAPSTTSPKQLVFRSPRSVSPEEVLDAQLRAWAAGDEERTRIPQGFLLQTWKRRLGIGLHVRRGGRPRLDARAELVFGLRQQGVSAKERARIVSEREGKPISSDDLSRWERYYLSRLRQGGRKNSSVT